MSKQREALKLALEVLEEINKLSIGENAICLPAEIDTAMDAIREALAEPEQKPEFWPGDVLICKEDDSKVTVVHGNRGPMQLMNGKIAIAWNDSVGGEYTIEQIKEMFYRTEQPEQEPVAWMLMNDTQCHIMATDWKPEDSDGWKTAPLYTAPPARKPLTDYQIRQIDELVWKELSYEEKTFGQFALKMAKAIERAHGIGD